MCTRLCAGMIGLAFVLVSCRVGFWSPPTTREVNKTNLIGTYTDKDASIRNQVTLRLMQDSAFEITNPESQHGSWQLDGNRITLTFPETRVNEPHLVGWISDDEGAFYLVLWREGDDPDDGHVFVRDK